MNIGNVIYNILSNNAALAALVGTKIYPSETPQAIAMPVVLYSIENIEPLTSKDGVSKLDVYSIDISCFSNKYDEMIDIYQAIRTALDRYKGTNSTIKIDQINFKNFNRDFIESAQVHQGSSTYEIRVKI